MKNFKNLRRRRAVSPVIAVLLMIVIAVASALFAYAWTMGYLDNLTVRVDQNIQIQSINREGSTINAYAMNIGSSPVALKNVYVNDTLDPNAAIEDPELDPGETTKITSTIYDGGTQVTVKVTTDSGNIFTLKKTFTGKGEYTLTINTVESGTVTKNPDQPTYHYGDTVELTANPTTGWSFSGWTGDLTGTDNPATVTMTSSITITATFTQDEYTLTTNIVGNGHVDRDDPGPYHYGDIVQLTAVDDLGWSFNSWSGDLVGSTNPDSITITGNKVITATFTANPPQTIRRSPSSDSDSGWSNENNAYADGGGYATSDRNNEWCIYSNYGFSIPSGATITQVRVRLDAWDQNNDDVRLEVYDGSWHTYSPNPIQLSRSQSTIWCDVTSLSSSGWSRTEVNSIQVRVTHVQSGSQDNIYLDWIPIEVNYIPP